MQTLSPARERGELALQERRLNLEPGLDTLAVGLGFLNAAHEFGYANAGFRQLLGQQADPCGRTLFEVLNFNAKSTAAVLTALQTGELWRGLLKIRDRALRVEIRSLPDTAARDSGGSLSHSVLLIDYSSDLKHLHKLAEAKNLAERTDKAKSEFLSHMSHELRTPLNAILGFTQLLRLSPELNPVQEDNLTEIEAAGNYLLDLINEILDLSSIEAGKIRLNQELVAVGALVDECMALVLPLCAARNIRLERHVAADSYLLTDPVRLKQIILNLLSNAIKYNRDDGGVCLYCNSTAANRIRLEIRDSGTGIEADKLRSIFSPFERLGADDSRIQGTGIGLMITRRLVNLMEGEIGVFSLEGQGSVFWVELPRNKPTLLDALLQDGSGYEAAPAAPAQPTLLWVGEPGPLYHTLARVQELRPGLQLQRCADTAAAHAQCERQRPHLVLLAGHCADEPAAPQLQHKTLKHGCVLVVKNQGVDNDALPETLPCVPTNLDLTGLLKLLDGLPVAVQPANC
jgi:signal transduction histidine kinase